MIGSLDGKRVTFDRVGRLVVPKTLREQAGVTAGEVEISVEGSFRIDVVATDDLVEEDGILMLPAGGEGLDSDVVREIRFADQRVTDAEKSLADRADWGPAEDWSDWADASR